MATINEGLASHQCLSRPAEEIRERYTLLQLYSVFVQICNYVLSAVGSILATVGRPEWVAITVAFSTTLQGWLRQNRIEERRLRVPQSGRRRDARMKGGCSGEHKMNAEVDRPARVQGRVRDRSVVDPLPTQVVLPEPGIAPSPTEQIEGLDEVINRDGKKR